MVALIFYTLAGGVMGAVAGYLGWRSRKPFLLGVNWQRGALYGAVFGVLFYFVAGIAGSAAMNKSTANVTHITDAEFEAEVIHSPKPVVADFYATWCGPCRILSPRLDALAGSFTNTIKFVKINVDESPKLAEQFNVQGIPTLLFFKNGEVVDSVVGLLSSGDLKAHLEALTETNAPANR